MNIKCWVDDWDPADLLEVGEFPDAIAWDNAPKNNVNSSLIPFEQSPSVPLLIPGYDFELGGDFDQDQDGIDDDGTRYALDVTQYVRDQIDNDQDGKITILMAVSNPDENNVDASIFFSKEYTEECDRPFLHFE